MGKPGELSRTGINPLGHYRKSVKKTSYHDNVDHGSSSSNSSGASSSSSSSNSSSNRNNKVVRGTLSRLGSYTSSKTSSSGSLGIKDPSRVKKRNHDRKGAATPHEVQLTMERSTSYAREFSGVLPDNELELEKVFKGNPNIWGFLESTNTTVVQSKLLERSPVGSTKTGRGSTVDRFAYLIGSGPTCDIRVPGNVLEQHHCMIYHRLEVQGDHEQNSILLNDRSKKGVWINNNRMDKPEIQLKNDDIISFKEADACEPCEYYTLLFLIKLLH
ncbi:hypothetical protein BDA99DRAFT_519274 [Phascolomyces articulosus]|uniref:FHA domain-containing protein n=1 Tax=Phascolomyces articulosus TaxID=60185 RepID=A0AAD5PAT9_9FUNG|nr:hypothetical protein BDA99DRAFT_519274 [Phascolomyces articulosus]